MKPLDQDKTIKHLLKFGSSRKEKSDKVLDVIIPVSKEVQNRLRNTAKRIKDKIDNTDVLGER